MLTILFLQWDFSLNGGRYMNGPRMSAANEICLKVFGDSGFRVLDTHRLTVGRRELAYPDGNHYWREGTTEEGVQLRIGTCYIAVARSMLLCLCMMHALSLLFIKHRRLQRVQAPSASFTVRVL